MSTKSFIDSVKVGSPCSEEWGDMKGNDRVRFCSHCAKDVNNLSGMTRKEATRLVRSSGGKLCVRYIVDPRTRRPIFAEQLLQITRRRPGIVAGVMTASVALSTHVYAQTNAPAIMRDPLVKVDKKNDPKPTKVPTSASSLMGTVVDSMGAVIPNAKIEVIETDTQIATSVTTDAEGVYRVDNLSPGKYRVETTSPGFVKSTREIELSDPINVTIELPVRMDVGSVGGVMVSVEYRSPLSQAVADEDKEQIRNLITNGARVNAREESYSKITPLFIAIETGDAEIVTMLLNAGAKINARDGQRQTPLMRLDQDATAEFVDLLIRYGAKVNVRDKEGNTPLTRAAENSTPEAVRALIDAGANINAVNDEGQTALMFLADRGDIDNVRLLLEQGASVNLRDKEGESAWDKAASGDIEELLKSYGAETPKQADDTEPQPTPEPTPPQ